MTSEDDDLDEPACEDCGEPLRDFEVLGDQVLCLDCRDERYMTDDFGT